MTSPVNNCNINKIALTWYKNELRHSPWFVISILSENLNCRYYIDKEWWNSKDFVAKAIWRFYWEGLHKYQVEALVELSPEKSFHALLNGSLYNSKGRLENRKEFECTFALAYPQAITTMNLHYLREDKKFMRKFIDDPLCAEIGIIYDKSGVSKDKAFMKALLSRNGALYKVCDSEIKNDYECAVAAFANDYSVHPFIDPKVTASLFESETEIPSSCCSIC